jgi:hypothetical protein
MGGALPYFGMSCETDLEAPATARRRDEDERVSTWRHPNQQLAAEMPAELRRVPVPGLVREWIRRHAGCRVVSVRRLPGASSTAVHAVRLADGRTLVLRRYVWDKFRAEEPESPARRSRRWTTPTDTGCRRPR